MIQCYLYASDLTKDCQVLSDYSYRKEYGKTLMNKNNLWSYYDAQNYKINSTYIFYDRSYEDYCYLTNQVEHEGKYVYNNFIALLVFCSLFVITLLYFFNVKIEFTLF